MHLTVTAAENHGTPAEDMQYFTGHLVSILISMTAAGLGNVKCARGLWSLAINMARPWRILGVMKAEACRLAFVVGTIGPMLSADVKIAVFESCGCSACNGGDPRDRGKSGSIELQEEIHDSTKTGKEYNMDPTISAASSGLSCPPNEWKISDAVLARVLAGWQKTWHVNPVHPVTLVVKNHNSGDSVGGESELLDTAEFLSCIRIF
ncbi:hypothetical protein EDC04DRAFT_2601118 [Pisolithus marmoratus]|nr:hypothetical protein EDC04DRAFT_2601118 [Pisolithus marmoratus]